MHPVPTLPTISEAKVAEIQNPPDSQLESRKKRPHRNSESSEASEFDSKNLPRNASQPAFTSHQQGIIHIEEFANILIDLLTCL